MLGSVSNDFPDEPDDNEACAENCGHVDDNNGRTAGAIEADFDLAIKLLLWAIDSGQYDDLDKEAWRIIADDDAPDSGDDEAPDRDPGP